jgi:DNA-binding transcriptional ArsR family regulator
MLRIRFDRDDLARMRFVLSPLGETSLSAQALQRDDGEFLLGSWRQRARKRLTPAARSLVELVPPQRHSLHTTAIPAPDVDRPTLQEELRRLRAVPPGSLRSYLAATAEDGGTVPAALRNAPDQDIPRLFDEMVRAYHEAGIAEDWPRLRRHLEADLAHRARILLGRGVGRTLATLHPTIRWSSPYLHVNGRWHHGETDLAGRGLVLMPSVFVWPEPVFLRDSAGGAALVYPAHDPFAFFWRQDDQANSNLAMVLGRTRAAALETVGASPGCSAGELARLLGISLAATSRHITVLRGAGLLATHRHGHAVFYTLTELGTRLLDGRAPDA